MTDMAVTMEVRERLLLNTEPFEERRMKVVSLKGRIMALMLNGSLDWDEGCKVRNYIDKEEDTQQVREENLRPANEG